MNKKQTVLRFEADVFTTKAKTKAKMIKVLFFGIIFQDVKFAIKHFKREAITLHYKKDDSKTYCIVSGGVKKIEHKNYVRDDQDVLLVSANIFSQIEFWLNKHNLMADVKDLNNDCYCEDGCRHVVEKDGSTTIYK